MGAVGFCVVSLVVFATVAFAERWLYQTLGLWGAYILWTVLFIVLGSAVFIPLIAPPYRRKWGAVFTGAFLTYAIGWVSAYFALPNLLGEWIGAFSGSVLMGLTFATGFGMFLCAPRLTGTVCLTLFVTNALGYFLGSIANEALKGQWGMLLWGGIYGIFLGAGIGATLSLLQTSPPRDERAE
jgi:hypothetical protein